MKSSHKFQPTPEPQPNPNHSSAMRRVFTRKGKGPRYTPPQQRPRRADSSQYSDDSDDDYVDHGEGDEEEDFEDARKSQSTKRRVGGRKAIQGHSGLGKRKRVGRGDNFREEDDDNGIGSDDGGDGEFVPRAESPLTSLSSSEREGMVARMVRYALFCDANKLPMKREEIARVVMGPHSRRRDLFRHVLAAADAKLKSVFGFEIKEVTRASKTMWVLRMCPVVNTEGTVDQQATSERARGLLGHSADETPRIGLLMVILALIFSHDERIGEEALFDHLRVLGLQRGVHHDVLGAKPEKLLDDFVRELYLERAKDKLEGAAAQLSGDAPKVGVVYSMGPRSKLEVQKMQIVEFLSSVTGMTISDDTKSRLEKEVQMSQFAALGQSQLPNPGRE